MSQAAAKKTVPKLILNDALSETVIMAVQKALGSMFSAIATPGKPTLETDFVIKGDISGLVGMVQDKMEAVMIVSFEKKTIFSMLAKVYGKEFSEIDTSVKQGVGEMTNIIYGLIKKSLNEKGFEFKLAIPNVVIGNSHTIINIHDGGKTLVVPFNVEGGTFNIEIAVQASSG